VLSFTQRASVVPIWDCRQQNNMFSLPDESGVLHSTQVLSAQKGSAIIDDKQLDPMYISIYTVGNVPGWLYRAGFTW
jgi:hypothetical protein